MNRKGFAPVIIVFLFVVIGLVVVIGVWFQGSWKNDFLSSFKAPSEKQEETISQEKPTGIMTDQKVPESQAVLVVKAFCDNFFKGPPALNEQGVMKAFDLLSQKAKQSMSGIGPSPSAALAHFAGVVDVPDQGYIIDKVSEEVEKATIKTTWKYSSGSVSKTFDLEKENGSWKINSIY